MYINDDMLYQAAQVDADKKLKKDDKKKELQELNELFKPVVAAQKISKGNFINKFTFFQCLHFRFICLM